MTVASGGAVGPIPTLTPTLVPSAPSAAPTVAVPSLVAALEATARATQPIPSASALAVPPAATAREATPQPTSSISTTPAPVATPAAVVHQGSGRTTLAQEGPSADRVWVVGVGEGTGQTGRLSHDEWVVVIGFTPSQDTIAMRLLGDKPRTAVELFGARLIKWEGWIHDGVFDRKARWRRGGRE